MTFSGPDWSVWVYDSSFEPPITPICATGKNTISVATHGLREAKRARGRAASRCESLVADER